MKLPNRDKAIIASGKLTNYLLNVEHKRGGTKARLLIEFGYAVKNWRQLEIDIRRHHLDQDVTTTKDTSYGVRYEIRAPLQTPSGRSLIIRTIWQIDTDKDVPRLITLFPD